MSRERDQKDSTTNIVKTPHTTSNRTSMSFREGKKVKTERQGRDADT